MFQLLKGSLAESTSPFSNELVHYDINLAIDYITLKLQRKIRRGNPKSVSFSSATFKPLISRCLNQQYLFIELYPEDAEQNSKQTGISKVFYKNKLINTPQKVDFEIHEVWLYFPGNLADKFLCNFYRETDAMDPYIQISFQRIDIKAFFKPFQNQYSELKESLVKQAIAIQEIENQHVFKRTVTLQDSKQGMAFWVGSIRSEVFFRAYIPKEPRLEPKRFFFEQTRKFIENNDIILKPLTITTKNQFLNFYQTTYNIESQLTKKKAKSLGQVYLSGDMKSVYFQCLEETLRWAKVPLSLELANYNIFDPINQAIKQYLMVTKYMLEQYYQGKLLDKTINQNKNNNPKPLEIIKSEFQRMYQSIKYPYPRVVNSFYLIEKAPANNPTNLPNNFFKFFNGFIESLQEAGKESLEEAKYLKFCKTMSQVTDKTKIVFAFNLKIPVKKFLNRCLVKNTKDNRLELQKFIDYIYQFDFEYYYEVDNERITKHTRLCIETETRKYKTGYIYQYNLKVNSSVFFLIS